MKARSNRLFLYFISDLLLICTEISEAEIMSLHSNHNEYNSASYSSHSLNDQNQALSFSIDDFNETSCNTGM